MVVGRDRLDPLRLELGQVGSVHDAAVGRDLGHDRVGDLAPVEDVAALLLDEPQRPPEIRVPNDAVEGRRLPVDQKRAVRIGIVAELPLDAHDVSVPALGLAPPFLGEAGRTLEGLVERQVAEPFEERVVACDGTRHRRGVHAGARHPLEAEAVTEELGRPSRRGPAGRVQRVEPLLLGHPHEGEEVPADPRVVLRRHVEHGRCGHRRVHRVPALLQDFQPGLRG